MTTPATPTPATLSSNQSVRFIVAALRRDGTYLLVGRDTAELYSTRNGPDVPLASLNMDAFRALAAADWIELGDHGQWRLATAGRDAMGDAKFGVSAASLLADDERHEPPVRVAAKPTARPTADQDSPLSWLHRRRDKQGRPLLSDHAFDAGERLRADFWFAAMTPRVTANWSPLSRDRSAQRSTPGGDLDMSDNVVAAKERVRRALAAVGPELSGILIDVCCHERGIEDTERETGWPVRSGRIVLQLALERLARHYGLGPPGQAETWTPEGRIRAWGDGRQRPTPPHSRSQEGASP
jgi:hypothetical protein